MKCENGLQERVIERNAYDVQMSADTSKQEAELISKTCRIIKNYIYTYADIPQC